MKLCILAAFTFGLFCLVATPLTQAARPEARPWMNTSLPPMKRAELLVKAMTLDEKIEQIHMADVKSHPREVPGIAYTSFAFSHLHVSTPDAADRVTVTLDLTNTGPVAGADVVQVYVGAPSSAGEPIHQLREFAKVNLAPGETQPISITLGRRAFEMWTTSSQRWELIGGKHQILVGDSSRHLPLHAAVTVRK